VRVALVVSACLVCVACGASRSQVARDVANARLQSACSGAGCAEYARVQGWATNATVAGALAFVDRCATCHTYRDVGTTRLGAPDLTHAGRRLSDQHLLEWIRCPECLDRSTSMPDFSLLPRSTTAALVALLRR
jgi:mono/diheme cytochrome c family protein